MEHLITAFYMTMELWILLAILGLALIGEEIYKYMEARNDAHQIRINNEIDRLHQ